MSEQDIIDRLDTLIAITRLTNGERIAEAGTVIRSDKVNDAILGLTGNWTPAGKLTAAVIKKTGQSRPTVARRVATLIEQGLLSKRGGGSSIEYRSTGLI